MAFHMHSPAELRRALPLEFVLDPLPSLPPIHNCAASTAHMMSSGNGIDEADPVVRMRTARRACMLLAAKIHPRFEKQFTTVKDMLPIEEHMLLWSPLERAVEWEDRHEFLKDLDAAHPSPADLRPSSALAQSCPPSEVAAQPDLRPQSALAQSRSPSEVAEHCDATRKRARATSPEDVHRRAPDKECNGGQIRRRGARSPRTLPRGPPKLPQITDGERRYHYSKMEHVRFEAVIPLRSSDIQPWTAV